MQVWAAGKLQAGWRFAPERATTTNAGGTGGGGSRERSGAAARKTLSTLVPYEHLTAKEKASSRNSALEMVRTLLYLGFTFESLNNKAVQQRVDALRTRMSDMALAAMRVRMVHRVAATPLSPVELTLSSMPPESCVTVSDGHAQFVQAWCCQRVPLCGCSQWPDLSPRAALFSGHSRHLCGYTSRRRELCRRNAPITPVSAMRKPQARFRCDAVSHCHPSYLAVQHGHVETSNSLLDLGAEVYTPDVNGTSPLAVASCRGSVTLVSLLLAHGASYTARDRIGMTPIHYAAFAGHTVL